MLSYNLSDFRHVEDWNVAYLWHDRLAEIDDIGGKAG